MEDSPIKTKFLSDGILVIDDFFTDEEVFDLKKAGYEMTKNLPAETRKIIYSATNTDQAGRSYFLESSDNISYFYEAEAVGVNGELVVDASESLNKVGHALHRLHPTFKRATFHPKVKQLSSELGLVQPRVVQSMFIYKNPKIGRQVTPHQDATYMHTEPQKLYGFWFPLEDATLENGCLWFIPGSHKDGIHRRFLRNHEEPSKEPIQFDKPKPDYPASAFRPIPVKKGACVLIHGQVVHKSEHNRSNKPRPVYTFHLYDAHQCKYSPENWLQTKTEFPLLYAN